jgi:hypothetical protein
MREHPDHHDADLLLRLYDLRREAKLREAREWFIQKFHADSPEDFAVQVPRGTKEHAFYRMVSGYWDMAASLVHHGLVNEELFFENTGEFWVVWQKMKHLVPATRQALKNPQMLKNLEGLSEKYEKWMGQRAPEALEALRALLLTRPPQKG